VSLVKKFSLAACAVTVAGLLTGGPVVACTNLLVTPGASADGSAYLAYAVDAHDYYGALAHTPAATWTSGATREIVEWDTGTHLGRIPQPARTHEVVGFMNEHQVSVGETTFGGREELQEPTGILDYGSLMFIALERAKTAREAIEVITGLVAEHGYASSGESLSIVDPEEAWILEIVGKGVDRKGAVWVARRIPDGLVSAHANQARIRTFPLDDPANCLFAPDVITFAREMGWYDGDDADFSFADTYAPIDFGALRFCEARVWSLLRRAAPSTDLPFEAVKPEAGAPRLPLWVRPDKKLTTADVMVLMRDHFEGTPIDMTQDVGAGPFACPYRWRPMTWEVDGQPYLHERAISTQQTGCSFVAQSRRHLPDPIGGVLWFGVDDTYTTVYAPMYCGIREVPHAYAEGTASMTEFSWDSAFWVFNWVANYAYSRYSDMIVDIQDVQRELEGSFFARQAEVEAAALVLFEQSPGLARDYLTRYSVDHAQTVVDRWRTLGQQLLVKYMDGNVKDAHGSPQHPPYPEHWYRRIAEERGQEIRRIEVED